MHGHSSLSSYSYSTYAYSIDITGSHAGHSIIHINFSSKEHEGVDLKHNLF